MRHLPQSSQQMQNIKFKITQTLSHDWCILERNSEEINLLAFRLDFIMACIRRSLYYRINVPVSCANAMQTYHIAHGVHIPRSNKTIYLPYSIFTIPCDLTNYAALIVTIE